MKRSFAPANVGVLCAATCLVLFACHKHLTQAQCDEIVGHYAELVVTGQLPDASAETMAKEKAREQNEARGDEGFKNCTTELEPSDHACAMRATTADALEACLK